MSAPFVADPDFTLYVGDALDVLRGLDSESVHCCVTSPPYWGLRDYGHDDQLGLEATPEQYVARMVAVFREVWRVLRPEGTVWLNLGDSYARDPAKGGSGPNGKHDFIPDYGKAREIVRAKRLPRGEGRWGGGNASAPGLKAKDLVGIPWRIAFALQADGWWLRMDNVWSKPNPMPESVRDRPTRAHEYVFLLSRSGAATHWRHVDGRIVWEKPRPEWYVDSEGIKHPCWRGCDYWYDQEAVAEPATWYGPNGQPKDGPHAGQMRGRAGASWEKRKAAGATRGNVAFDGNVGAGTQRGVHGEGVSHDLGDGFTRNARSVWTIQTQQYADAHFAVFPEELPRRCILAGCPAGGVVLDPFMGSGTTALVARAHGRKSVGIELSPEYARLAAKRLGQLSLLAEPAA